MPIIKSVKVLEIIDSRATPTLKVTVETDSGAKGSACVPSGASTGEYEAVELRDNDNARFLGKGVLRAKSSVEDVIAPALQGSFSVLDQRAIDEKMIALDGTNDKSNLGANAILGVSLACAHASADYLGVPLYFYLGGMTATTMPMPMMNILNGGAHADNSVDFQEFMIIPKGAKTIADAVRMGCEVFHSLKALLKQDSHNTAVGDEGGFAPNLQSNTQALEYIVNAIAVAGYKAGEDVCLALDVAASEFYDKASGKYILSGDNKSLSADEMIDFLCGLCEKFPIISIEDGLDQNDFENTAKLTSRLKGKVQIVGDDLFVTNTKRLKKGIEMASASAILIKPNQIGTLTETVDAVRLAQKNGYGAVISHRSGETEDSTIADIAVGLNAGQIKTGSLSRAERTAKYNRLIEIEDELNSKP